MFNARTMAEVRSLIEEAVRLTGSEARLGEAAGGFSQNAVWQAKRRGRVSAELARGIDKATNGKISAHDLRPDLWPEEVRRPSDKESVA